VRRGLPLSSESPIFVFGLPTLFLFPSSFSHYSSLVRSVLSVLVRLSISSFLLVYRQLIGQCLCFLHPLLYSLSAVPSSYFDWRILISNGCQIVLLRAYFIYNIIIILLLYHQYVSSTIHNHCSVSRHGVCAYSSQHACTLNLYFFVNLFHTNVIHEESIYNIYTYTQHTTTYMTPKR
jgi:hypothetical protein